MTNNNFFLRRRGKCFEKWSKKGQKRKPILCDVDPTNLGWFKHGSSSSDPIWEPFQSKLLFVGVPGRAFLVRSHARSGFLGGYGVFGAYACAESYGSRIEEYGIPEDSFVFVTDENGKVLGNSTPSTLPYISMKDVFAKHSKISKGSKSSGRFPMEDVTVSFSRSREIVPAIHFLVTPVSPFGETLFQVHICNIILGCTCVALLLFLSRMCLRIEPKLSHRPPKHVPDDFGSGDIQLDRRLSAIRGSVVTPHTRNPVDSGLGYLVCLSMLLFCAVFAALLSWAVIGERALEVQEEACVRASQRRVYAEVNGHFAVAEGILSSAHDAALLLSDQPASTTLLGPDCYSFYKRLSQAAKTYGQFKPVSLFAMDDRNICGVTRSSNSTDSKLSFSSDGCVRVSAANNGNPTLNCSFHPTRERWFTGALKSKTAVWTDQPSGLGNTDSSVMLSKRFPSSGKTFGVIGIELSLKNLSTFLERSSKSDSSSDTHAYVITPGLGLLSSSQKLSDRECGSHCLLQDDSDETATNLLLRLLVDVEKDVFKLKKGVFKGKNDVFIAMKDVSKYKKDVVKVTIDVPEVETISSPKDLARSIDDPMTFVGPAGHSKWVTAVTVKMDKWISDSRMRTFLVVIGSALIILVMAFAQFLRWHSEVSSAIDHEVAEAEERFGKVDVSSETLEELKVRIESEIKRSLDASWKRLQPTGGDQGKDFIASRAVQHVEEAHKGRNVIRFCLLDREELGTFPRRLYMLLSHTAYRTAKYLTVLGYICMSFWEPLTNELLSEEFSWCIHLAQLASLVFLISDFVGRAYVLRVEGSVLRDMEADRAVLLNHGDVEVEKPELKISRSKRRLALPVTFLTQSSVWSVYALNAFLLTFLLVDWTIVASVRWSYHHYIPLRPFLLVVMSRRIREGSFTFIKSIYKAVDVLVLLMSSLVIAATFGVAMFHGKLNPGKVESGYDDFVRSWMATFTYLMTAENFPDIVFPGIAIEPFSAAYFTLGTLLVFFIITGMVTGYFQDGFQHMQKVDLRKRKLYSRVGIIGAFTLLDSDGKGFISRQDFEDFMISIHPEYPQKYIAEIFDILDVEEQDDRLVLKEFVDGIEEFTLRRIVDYRISKTGPSMIYKFLRSDLWEQFNMIVIMTHILVMSLYGVMDDPQFHDLVALGFLAYFMIETFVRALVYGFNEFWDWAYYHKPGLYQMYSHRGDVCIIGMTFCAYAINVYSSGSMYLGDTPRARLVLCIPILRAFTRPSRTRFLVFSFIQILPLFTSIVSLMLVVMFVYTIIGTTLFYGTMSALNEGNPDWNFDTFSNALVALMMCWTGESNDAVMNDAVRAGGLKLAIFFNTYCIIVFLLFSNLFIGLVLSVFALIVSPTEKSEERSYKELDRIVESL
eukprot:149783_1